MLKKEQIKTNWYLFDATDIPLGRLSTILAKYLTGKNEVDYTPNLLRRNHLIVLNADKVLLTGKKSENKIYYKHTGYMGGLKEININKIKEKHFDFPIRKAVERMLNKNPTRNKIIINNLHIYNDENHNNTNVKNPIVISKEDILNGF